MTTPTPTPAPATIMVTGRTYHVRAELRALGGRWVVSAKGWEVPADKAAEVAAIMDRAKAAAKAERAATRKANADAKAREQRIRDENAAALAKRRAEYVRGSDGLDPTKTPHHYHESTNAQWARCVSMLKPGSEFNVCTNFMFDRGTIWRVRVSDTREAIIVGIGSWWAMSVHHPTEAAAREAGHYGAALGVAIIRRHSGCEGYHMAVDVGYDTKLDEGNG